MNTFSKNNNYLYDVAIVRLILVVLLVFYHAFAPYSGGWPSIDGILDVRIYWWLDKLCYAFMLETFVFISGYTFGFQVRTKGDVKLNAKNLLWGKFKRLIIPSVVFSLLYMVLIQGLSDQTPWSLLYAILAGAGHMWFLPMLFWCFVGVWLIEKTGIRPNLVIITLLVLSITPKVSLPLQIDQTLYYILFFYVGYYIQRYSYDWNFIKNGQFLLVIIFSFIAIFPLLTLLATNVDSLIEGSSLMVRIVRIFIIDCSRLVYSCLGLIMLYGIVNFYLAKINRPLRHWIVDVSGLCMGVYIFQQFILRAIYYKTALPILLGTYLLPWVSFVLTLVLSLVIAFLFHKTKSGRFLIG